MKAKTEKGNKRRLEIPPPRDLLVVHSVKFSKVRGGEEGGEGGGEVGPCPSHWRSHPCLKDFRTDINNQPKTNGIARSCDEWAIVVCISGNSVLYVFVGWGFRSLCVYFFIFKLLPLSERWATTNALPCGVVDPFGEACSLKIESGICYGPCKVDVKNCLWAWQKSQVYVAKILPRCAWDIQ